MQESGENTEKHEETLPETEQNIKQEEIKEGKWRGDKRDKENGICKSIRKNAVGVILKGN